jgi:hypothetical protein
MRQAGQNAVLAAQPRSSSRRVDLSTAGDLDRDVAAAARGGVPDFRVRADA